MVVDVLIITALPMEFDAAKTAGAAVVPGGVGVARWEPRSRDEMVPYLLGEFVGPGNVSLSVALARSAHMGGRVVSPVTSKLVDELRPRCLAMSGVCAGNPARAALGDVVVPTLVYAFDGGKQAPTGFKGSHRQIPAARTVACTGRLPCYRELIPAMDTGRRRAWRTAVSPGGRGAQPRRARCCVDTDDGYSHPDHVRFPS